MSEQSQTKQDTAEAVTPFRRTGITIFVLSDVDIPAEMTLSEIMEECETGAFLAQATIRTTTETLTPRQMVSWAYAAGSDPGFFGLDDEGNPL